MVDLLRRYSNLSDLDIRLKRAVGSQTREAVQRPSGDQALPRRRKLSQRLDPATVAALVVAYEAGTPSAALARRHGLAKSSVLKLLHEQGIALRNQGLSEQQVTMAVQLYQAGWSLQRVGDHFDVDDETVRQALRRLGVQLRGPHDHRMRR